MSLKRISPIRMGLLAAFLIALAAQITFSHSAQNVATVRELLPPVPSDAAREVMAMGDREFLFRIVGLHMQNAGDTGGRDVPIKEYDFDTVAGWFDTLHKLNAGSDFSVALAIRFYGQSQNVEHVRPVVEFVRRNVSYDPGQKWRWLFEAIYLARKRLGDEDLALDLAYELASYVSPEIPIWPAMAPAFILEDMAKFSEAQAVIENARARFGGRMSSDDREWTESYLKYLRRMEDEQSLPQSAPTNG